MRYMSLVGIVSISCCTMMALSSCAISNEGATDYRVMPALTSELRKNVDPNTNRNQLSVIEKGKPIVVVLKSAFIAAFSEFRSPLRYARLFVNGKLEPASGEVAIVVNVFEEGEGQKIDFGPNGTSNARVVFFSDDVWEGQFLNFSNLNTVYGPLEYKGNPFFLDVYVVEFDMPGPQLRQLMANLAEIGSTAYPPHTL